MTGPAIHIIGAGLAGLAAALSLSAAGRKVQLYEAGKQAGGRCRSYHDKHLDAVIDNGNHLLMSANQAALDYLAETGASDSLIGPEEAVFPFFDRETGEHYAVRPNDGPLPWWILSPKRRLPDTSMADYLAALKLIWARGSSPVGTVAGSADPLYRPFWEPLVLAVINISPDRAPVSLLRTMLLETFAKGGARCRPLIARDSLAASFVDPALKTIEGRGGSIRYGSRIRAIDIEDGRASALRLSDGEVIALEPGAAVVLAVTPSIAAALLPGLTVPEEGSPIVNAHYRLPQAPRWPAAAPLIGILGGHAHWIFGRGDLVSITVSGAEDLVDRPAEELLPLLWSDTAAALGIDDEPLPPGRLVKEKRATFTQDTVNIARRPGPVGALGNLVLAGDWTDTGLPATIESAVRSGRRAAEVLLMRA